MEDSKRQELQELQSKELQLSTAFTQGLQDSQESVSLPLNRVRQLPEHVQRQLRGLRKASPQRRLMGMFGQESVFDVASNPTSFSFIMNRVSDSEIRRAMYTGYYSGLASNSDTLNELLQTRHSLAKVLGAPSHAHYSAQATVAGTPENIIQFLDTVDSFVRPIANQELADIEKAKGSPVEAWDLDYYRTKLKRFRVDLEDEAVAPYLTVDNCIAALNTIVQSLFGIEMILVENVPKTEIWHKSVQKLIFVQSDEAPVLSMPRGSFTDVSPLPLRTVSHAEALEFEHSLTQKFVGTCYLDVYERPNKYTNPAHFTIRCGRHSRSGDIQTPIIALVFNLDQHSGMAMNDVEVFFHEFGHALHSLLSRTETQHLSGTRGALDFVETPSHLFENFVWDSRVMSLFARDPVTKEAMPLAMRMALLNRNRTFSAIATQQQILLAATDIHLHSRPPPEGVSQEKHTTQLVRETNNKYALIPDEPGAHYERRFGHLVWYGGGYYSYLWCKIYATNIWKRCLIDDPLNRKAGHLIHERLLKHGGSKDPVTLLRDTLGGEPSIQLWREHEF
eukprot:c52610_g1_i1.p1 GENE.c52610_g1_i1~~c52610_g1_i1.p1  ORF type:complete len:635 (+),score=148.65 c52610_g1_i1:221-1906(+)